MPEQLHNDEQHKIHDFMLTLKVVVSKSRPLN